MITPKPVVGLPKQIEPKLLEPEIGFVEGLGAAFERENSLVSAAVAFGVRGDRQQARIRQTDEGIFQDAPDPNFDPFKGLEGTPYEGYSRAFIGVQTAAERRVVIQNLDRQLENQETLSLMGGKGIAAALLAGITDPINLVPVGGTVYKGARLGTGALKTGGSTALAAGAGAALAEVGLHATQDTRTAKESADAILFSMALGGVLGGGVGAFASTGSLKGKTPLSERLRTSPAFDKINLGEVVRDGSIGAAQVKKTSVKDESLVGALGLEKVLKKQSPMMRTMTSGLRNVMADTLELVETPFLTNKNAEGVRQTASGEGAVETMRKLAIGHAVRVSTDVDDIFIEMRKGTQRKFGDVTKLAATDKLGNTQGMSRQEFFGEISTAFESAGKHDNPFVVRAATEYKNLFESYGKKAEELGLIPEGTVGSAVQGGGWYFPNMYDQVGISGNRGQWEGILARDFNQRATQYAEELDLVSEDLRKLKSLRAEVEASLPNNSDLNILRNGPVIDTGLQRPIIDLLKSMGGIHPDTNIAGELRNMGLTPKTAPGLFSNSAPKREFDNLVRSEIEILADNTSLRDDGLVDFTELMDLIGEELAGNPARLADEAVRIDAELARFEDLGRWLDEKGIDVLTMNNDKIRQRLLNLDGDDLQKMPRAANELGENFTVKDGEDPGFGSLSDIRTEADLAKELEEMKSAGAQARQTFGKHEMERIEKLELRAESLRKLSRADNTLDAQDLAREVTDAITGALPGHEINDVISGISGPLRARTLDIDPRLTREFRITDPAEVAMHYASTMSVDTQLVKKFRHVDMRDQIQRYRDDIADMRDKAQIALGRKLLKDGKIDHLSDFQKRAIIRGSYVDILEITDPKFLDAMKDKGLAKEMHRLKKLEDDVVRDVTKMN